MADTAVAGVVAQPEDLRRRRRRVTAINDKRWNRRSCRRPQPPTRGHALRGRRRRQRRPRCRIALRPGLDRRGRGRRTRQVPIRCRRNPGLGPGRHPDDRHIARRDRGLPERTRLPVEWRSDHRGARAGHRVAASGRRDDRARHGRRRGGPAVAGTHEAGPRCRGRSRAGGVRPARSFGRLHTSAEPARQCQPRRDRRIRFERHQRASDLRTPQRRLHRPDRSSWNRPDPRRDRDSATPPKASSW